MGLLEALSFGCCLLSSDIPENVEVFREAGLTFPPGDVEAMRNVLARVLDEPDLVPEYRRKAEQQALARPDWDEVARLTEEVYLETVGAV